MSDHKSDLNKTEYKKKRQEESKNNSEKNYVMPDAFVKKAYTV